LIVVFTIFTTVLSMVIMKALTATTNSVGPNGRGAAAPGLRSTAPPFSPERSQERLSQERSLERLSPERQTSR
jgi:hypothetical protein